MATEIGPWQYATVLSRASLLGRSVMQWKRMEKRPKARQRERDRVMGTKEAKEAFMAEL